MDAPNRNILWARVLVDEMARAGLRAVCIAPGSRSTPLTLAFANQPDITVYSHIDERSAAYFALGLARAGDFPVALVCTSGTAAANFYPAIIEAQQSQIPLLVLTADRPHDQRDSGANQTIDQVKMYGGHVRWFVDVAPPEAGPPVRTLGYLRTLANRALAVAQAPPAGPVHLNFPFRKPLEPVPAPEDRMDDILTTQAPAVQGRSAGQPYVAFARGRLMPTAAQIERLVAAIRATPRGVIVCGPRRPVRDDPFPTWVGRLAQIAGYPIFADPLSGVRFGPHVAHSAPFLVAGYETILQTEFFKHWEAPTIVLRFGAMPTSRWLQNALAAWPAAQQIYIDAAGTWHDASYVLSDYIQAEAAETCRQVTEHLLDAAPRPWDEPWLSTVREVEQLGWEAWEDFAQDHFFEGVVLADVADALPAEALLFASNSLPVRDLDQFARPRQMPLHVFANRGASGIDGIVSSALGTAAARGRPVVLVTGDLAFYHDLNGLLALRRCGVKATIVVLQNDGGGIFHRLPIARFEPPFTDLFVTPHGLDFEPAVRMYGAEFTRVTTRSAFQHALETAITHPESWVIEVASDRVQNEALHRQFVAEARRRISQRMEKGKKGE